MHSRRFGSFKVSKHGFIWTIAVTVLALLANFVSAQGSTPKVVSFSVFENVTVGSEVGRLNRTDGTAFFIVSVNGNDLENSFDTSKVKSEGVFITTRALDHEGISFYEVLLYHAFTYYKVEMSVADVNDNSPVFSEVPRLVDVSEASRVGWNFNIGSATDRDSEPYNVKGYRIVDGNEGDVFRVENRRLFDTVSAELYLNKSLNREEISFYTLTVEAYDGGNPPKVGRTVVNITVTDVNDNAPMFDLTRYTVSVQEDRDIGFDIISVTATDLDEGANGNVSYRINRQQSDPDMYFIIDSTTGQISLNRRIDYEAQDEHKIVIEAVDQGSVPNVGSTVVIVNVVNVNDNKPNIDVIFFNENGAKISEATQVGSYIARVSLSDPDGIVTTSLSLSFFGGDNKFDLETTDNIIFLLLVKNVLDREMQDTYHITFAATDKQNSLLSRNVSYTITIEDVNDNPPTFNKDEYDVQLDNTAAGAYVEKVQATDLDVGTNAQISYSLASTSYSDRFNINPDSGLVTTRQDLDSVIGSPVLLTVIATDKGSPPLKSNTTLVVSLPNSSSIPPVFERTSYVTSTFENVSIGVCILKVRANSRDANALLSYSFVNGASGLPFDLNSVTGDICMTSSLDRESTAEYEFEIQVFDQNNRHDRARVRVIVDDVNEFAPVFRPVSYAVNVDRLAEADDPVTELTAVDEDNVTPNLITFAFVSGNEDGFFKLDQITGRISVAKSLRGLVGLQYVLVVSATDEGGLSSRESASVTISVVDESHSTDGPVFTLANYQFEIDENANVSTTIGQVSAFSKDGSAVTYQLRKDPPNSSWFEVSSRSGELSVSAEMDREILPNSSIQVIASSGTPPVFGFASVLIILNDVNDNAPHLIGSVNGILPPITIPYSMDIGTVVSTLSVVDNDSGQNGTVRYAVSSSYFSIDHYSGEIILRDPLPQQEADYEIIIESRDLGIPSLVTMTSLTVLVRHPDRYCPIFSRSIYAVSILENFPLSISFATLDVMNWNPNADFKFQLRGSDAYPFAFFPNGSLYLVQSVDRELKIKYTFSTTAFGNALSPDLQPFCFTNADVIVTIDDINDTPPKFNQSAYEFHLVEGLSSDAVVGSVHAVDSDSTSNARVAYQFAVANSYFVVHPITGLITTVQPLDRESTPRFNFLVEATDGANTAQTNVHIRVGDINDNVPIFSVKAQLAVVSVNSNPGTWVADVRATDPDEGDNGTIRYSIDDSPLFTISSTLGTVSAGATFTQSDIGVHTLTITATDGGTPALSTNAELKVRIRTASGNPAQFSEDQFVFTPFENLELGQIIGSFDSSPSTRQRRSITSFPFYQIRSGSGWGVVSVNQSNGVISLRRKFSYESAAQLSLAVERRMPDNVTALRGQINIRDINDHTPTFASGTFYIGVNENIEMGKEVYRFSASDNDSGLDGEVRYSLIYQDPLPAFEINPVSGAVLVNAVLDRENISEYVLVVRATDLALTSPRFSTVSCVITLLDVNDHVPQFVNPTMTYVKEDEPIGYPIICFTALDFDFGANAIVTYALVSIMSKSNDRIVDPDLFYLDPVSGLLTLTESLDHENSSSIIVNVSASDGSVSNPLTGYQEFEIRIINVNDFSPRFERVEYDAEATEGQESGVIVTRVKAVDGDFGFEGQVTYFLQRSTDFRSFIIDSSTGIITTTASLDREERPAYTLSVVAQDAGTPPKFAWTTVNVIVRDVNDNHPQFQPLDGSTDPPILIRLRIPEQSDEPELIYVVSAQDADFGENSRISYSITDGNTNGDFFLNQTSGELWTSRKLDRERTGSYRLRLVATDHGEPALFNASLVEIEVLDWNDNKPVFERDVYEANVTEEMLRGQFVVTVKAVDFDEGANGQVRYYFVPLPTDFEAPFEVDPALGLVTTAASLDREKVGEYHLKVMAVDSSPYNPLNSTVALVIRVLDVNDNYPVFDEPVIQINVTRSEGSGAVVRQAHATDDDVGANGDVIYSFSNSTQPQHYFSIDSTTGDVMVNSSLIDLPLHYTFFVSATDQGNPPRKSEAVVFINIVGEQTSMSALQFANDTYDAQFWENVGQGFSVRKVEATIIGNGGNEVTYRILRCDNEARAFSISQQGVISVADSNFLDYERKQRFSLIVLAAAEDQSGSATLYSSARVNILLEDENDNPPKFSQLQYYANVLEEQHPMFVMQVQASDADSGENGRIRYYISSGDPDDAFAIDERSGVLRTTRRLDSEVQDSYQLLIVAADFGDRRMTGSCTAIIDVVDLNDHSPILLVPSNEVMLREDTAVGTLVSTVTANDVDRYQIATYALIKSNLNSENFFNIDKYGGQIFLTSPLDYETRRNITLRVMTSDGEYTDFAFIHIQVVDLNDNYPEFDQSSYQGKVNELTPVGREVLTVRATDLDSEDNARISYRIINISPSRDFLAINPITGVISTNRSFPFDPALSVLNLEVEATDHGTPPLAQTVPVLIEVADINDQTPIFSPQNYERRIVESVPRGYLIVNVTATDDDYAHRNKDIYYEIVSGNVGGAFKIRTNKEPGKAAIGEIRTAYALDREEREHYEIVVAAFDRGVPQRSSNATVRIQVLDVNDNQPWFNTSRYYGNVRENNEETEPRRPIPVLSVFATDVDRSDSNIAFTIISGNDEGSFEVEACTSPSPTCALITARVTDYETVSHYRMTLQVTDRNNRLLVRSSTAEVIVDVQNVNEYPPVVEASRRVYVNETTRANQTLFYIFASDRDLGHYGHIVFTVKEERTPNLGPSCPSSQNMFVVEPGTGAVSAKQELDYEKCRKFNFQVESCDPEDCVISSVEVNVDPVDEYSPQFEQGGFQFQVPFGSPPGYVVGMVIANDEDADEDGEVHYYMEESVSGISSLFLIDELSGVISLSRRVDSANSHILFITAASGTRRSSTYVTIAITGAPAVFAEAQILATVFGIITFLAFAIILILCVKHRRNKKASKYSEPAQPNQEVHAVNKKEKDDVSGRKLSDDVFYDVAEGHSVSPLHVRKTAVNGVHCNGHHKVEPPVISNGAGDFQLHNMKSYHGVANGKPLSLPADGKQITMFGNTHYFKKISGSRRSLEGSAEDEEVHRITSTPSSSGRQSSPESVFSVKPQRIADSGIQQDIDKESDQTDGSHHPHSESDSIPRVRKEDVLDASLFGLPRQFGDKLNTSGARDAKNVDRSELGNRTDLLSSLGSLDDGSSKNSKKAPLSGKKWAPDFQPLSSVFSEIVRLREESAIMRDYHKARGNENREKLASQDDFERPPPLFTSVPQRNDKLAAPIPLSSQNSRLGPHVTFKGLHLRSSPKYIRSQPSLSPVHTQSYTAPPPYSHVLSKRPSSGNSSWSSMSRSSHHSQRVSSLPINSYIPPPFTAQPLSSTSLSHKSSCTSPAMSPSLSPSLTSHSPPPFKAPNFKPETTHASDLLRVIRLHDHEVDPSNQSEERMVHV